MPFSSSTPTLDAPRRIVVRGVNWLGDAVMSTPALLRLRERFPQATITIFTADKLRELWLHHPAADDVLGFAAGESLLSIRRRLRYGRFDLALVFPNSPRSALEMWLAGIPRRVGFARAWRNWFLTTAVPPRPGAVTMRKRGVAEIQSLIARNPDASSRIARTGAEHQMHDLLHLVGALGADKRPLPPRLVVTEPEIAALRKRFPIPSSKRIVGLNAGAEYGPAKRWPVENFVNLARALLKESDVAFLVFGGRNDQLLAGQIGTEIRSSGAMVHNLAGQTTLRELCAGLKLCNVVITNDTGPMHVAAALGTPVVVPFGSTSPELTGPGSPDDVRNVLIKSTAPCSPCFLRECPIDFRCMKGITVEAVLNGARTALNSQP